MGIFILLSAFLYFSDILKWVYTTFTMLISYQSVNLMSLPWNQTALKETSAKKWEALERICNSHKIANLVFNPDT